MAELLGTTINGSLEVRKSVNDKYLEVIDNGNTIIHKTLKVDNIENNTESGSLTIKAPTVIENDSFTVKPIEGTTGTEYLKIFKNNSTMQVNIKPSTTISGSLSANSKNFVSDENGTEVKNKLTASSGADITGVVNILNNTNKTDGNLNVANNTVISGKLEANKKKFIVDGDTTTIKSNNFNIQSPDADENDHYLRIYNNDNNTIVTDIYTPTNIKSHLIVERRCRYKDNIKSVRNR